jgi:hypothetical protein
MEQYEKSGPKIDAPPQALEQKQVGSKIDLLDQRLQDQSRIIAIMQREMRRMQNQLDEATGAINSIRRG